MTAYLSGYCQSKYFLFALRLVFKILFTHFAAKAVGHTLLGHT